MKSAVVVFPGSNCDRDMAVALRDVTGREPAMIWHGEHELPDGLDLITVPGGFSYGDYLRSGAVAARSNIMRAIVDAAQKGVRILGVCNGFQVLTEAGLLPGALMRNAGLNFVCKTSQLKVATRDSDFTSGIASDEVAIPIAHHDGNYFASDEELHRLEAEDRIAFRYTDNPNGSRGDIAGILNENRTVLGMMPHPERAVSDIHPTTDGRALFESLLS